MVRKQSLTKSVISSIVIFSFHLSSMFVFPQDLVAAEDISGGGQSVFVFRRSRKDPQEKAAMRGLRAGGGRVRVSKAKYETQVAVNRKRRSDQAKANEAQLARNRARQQRNAKSAASIALTAKADGQLMNGQIDSAIATYREALKNNPQNAEAKLGLSDALAAKGIESAGDTNNIAAAPYLEEAVALDPNNDVAYAKLGEVYDAKNDASKARINYEKALQINPEFTTLYVPVGISYLNGGEIQKAEYSMQNAEKRGVSDADFYNLKGMVLFKQNKNAESLAAFEKALALDGRNATAKYYRAMMLDRLNQPDQSIAAYKDTLAADPSYSAAWFDLGVTYYNKGDYTNALSAYKEAVRIDPEFHQAHANLASTYRQLERFAEANAQYKLAEVGIKDNPDLYLEWGFCLGKTNEWDKAVVRLDQARKLSPNAVDESNLGWAYYNAAQVDKQNKKDAEATAKLEKSKASLTVATQQDPKLDAAYMNLGSTNNALGDFEGAVAALNVALSLHRDWVIAINQLGIGYRGLNNLSAAIQQFNRVVTLDANNVQGLFNLGSAQYAIGDKKAAKKTQERLKKLNPALATSLGNILDGKAIVDDAKRKIESKVPRIPRIPF